MPSVECVGGPWDGRRITLPPTTERVHVYRAPEGIARDRFTVPPKYQTPEYRVGTYEVDANLFNRATWKPEP